MYFLRISSLLFTLLVLAGCSSAPQPSLSRFVTIPAGELDHVCPAVPIPCGTSSEKKFRATISEFQLAEHETTVAMFRNFVSETGYVTNAEKSSDGQTGCLPYAGFERSAQSWRAPGFIQTDAEPVVCLSLADIQAYIRWLNAQGSGQYRLPTADEWRYVVILAGNNSAGDAGNAQNVESETNTIAVSALKPNVLGLKGLQSNVSEFTASCRDEMCEEVVVLGASYYDDTANICEDFAIPAQNRLPFFGFRLVKEK